MNGFGPHNWSGAAPTNKGMAPEWFRSLPKLPLPIAQIVAGQPGYPKALSQFPDPATPLWYVGRLPSDSERAVAMVGSRAATRVGCDRASQMAGALVRAGYAVISGGALGI